MPVNYDENNSADIDKARFELQALRKNAMATHDLNISALSGITGGAVEYQRSLEKTIYSRYMDIINQIEMKLARLAPDHKTEELQSADMGYADGAMNRLLDDDFELL